MNEQESDMQELQRKDEMLQSPAFSALMTAYKQASPNCQDRAFKHATDFAITFVANTLEKS